MDITILAAWGEFLGGIAVVVSLVYLASQIRQNSRLMQISTTVSFGEADIELAKLPIENPEVWRILEDGYEGREAFSRAEDIRFRAYLDLVTRLFQTHYFLAQDGAIRPDVWKADIQVNLWMLRQPGPRSWWSESSFSFSDEFVEFLDGLIREGDATG